MFDIGFFELIVLGIIGLLVLGPERLPGAIRTLGLWIGRLRRSFNTIKADIEREVGADEIRRQLRNEEIMAKIKSTRTQFKESVESGKKQAEAVKQDLSIEKELSGLKDIAGKPATEERPTAEEAGKQATEKMPAAGEAGKPVTAEIPPAGEAGKPATQESPATSEKDKKPDLQESKTAEGR